MSRHYIISSNVISPSGIEPTICVCGFLTPLSLKLFVNFAFASTFRFCEASAGRPILVMFVRGLFSLGTMTDLYMSSSCRRSSLFTATASRSRVNMSKFCPEPNQHMSELNLLNRINVHASLQPAPFVFYQHT